MTTPAAPPQVRLRPLMAALWVTAVGVLPAALTGALGPRLRADLDLTETGLGAVIGVFYVATSISARFGGRLADDIGWARASRLAAVGSALSLLGIAVAGRSLVALVVLLATSGASLGVAMPASSAAISREMPPHRQAVLFGIKQTALPVAGILAGLSVPLVALTVGWRWAYAGAAALAAAVVVLIPGGSPRGERVSRAARPVLARRRVLAAIAIGGGSAAMSVGSLAAFVVIAAVESGMDEGSAGVLVAVASALGLLIRVGGGWAADRAGSRGFLPVSVMLAVGALGFLLLAGQQVPTVIVGTIIAYGAGWGWPGLFYFGVAAHHPATPGSATGFVQVGVSGGGAIGPLLIGLVAASAGFGAAWLVAAGLMVFASVVLRLAAPRLQAPVPVV